MNKDDILTVLLATFVEIPQIKSNIGIKRQPFSAEDAVSLSKSIPFRDERVEYLLSCGWGFIEEEKFEEARALASHIIGRLDKNSYEARDLYRESQKNEKSSPWLQMLAAGYNEN